MFLRRTYSRLHTPSLPKREARHQPFGFNETKPLPVTLSPSSWEPFEFVTHSLPVRNKVPVRHRRSEGQNAGAKYAAEVTAPASSRASKNLSDSLPLLECRSLPFPTPASAPWKRRLVTYDQILILAAPQSRSDRRSVSISPVARHELAPMVLVDLVTRPHGGRYSGSTKPSPMEWNATHRRLETGVAEPAWSDVGAMMRADGDILVSARKVRKRNSLEDDIIMPSIAFTYKNAPPSRFRELDGFPKNCRQRRGQSYLKQ